MEPGDRLREIRGRLGMSTREVAQLSSRIAVAEQNPEFLISSPWLTQLENKTALPSVFKLFTLAAIYGLTYNYVLTLYGVNLKKVIAYHSQMPVRKTHLAELDFEEIPPTVELPIRFDAGVNLNKTTLLSRMVDTWGMVPPELIQGLDFRRRLYGFVGLEDYRLFPLVRPGSFVEINPESKKPRQRLPRSEFDRPIYFVDLREECACAWCDIVADSLLLLSHPLSPCETTIVKMPDEGEIIGEVTGIAMRLGPASGQRKSDSSRTQTAGITV
jgi:transcriptional regulator with XRE-family HTH domain